MTFAPEQVDTEASLERPELSGQRRLSQMDLLSSCGHRAAVHDGEASALRKAGEELLQYVTHVQVVYRRTPEPADPDPTVAQAG